MQFNEIYRDVALNALKMPGLLLVVFTINTLPLVYADINWTEPESIQLGGLIGIMNLYLQYLVVKQFLLLSGRTGLAGRKFAPRIFEGQIIYMIAVLVGLICLVIPGIYLALKFSLYVQFIVDEDLTIGESFSKSWAMTDGQFVNILILTIPIILLFPVLVGLDFLPILHDYPLTYWTLSESLLSLALILLWLLFSAIYNTIQNQLIENS